ncbi:ribonuclease III [Candidatus Zixiibacteriota bacterium]
MKIMLSGLLRLLGIRRSGADLDRLQKILGYHFANPRLLEQALTHRSYINLPEYGQLPSYERLEFLGDSVLGVIVAEYVYNRFGKHSEGDLTKLKAGVVNIHSLTHLARSLGLGTFIKLSPEERRAGGADRPSILSDVFESLTGAIFLDGGMKEAREWIGRVLLNDFDRWRMQIEHINYKGNLLEYLQGRGQGMPRYDVLTETGPDHDKTFTVRVFCLGRDMGIGQGSSKKEAEQAAAEEALGEILDADEQNSSGPSATDGESIHPAT